MLVVGRFHVFISVLCFVNRLHGVCINRLFVLARITGAAAYRDNS